MCPAPCSCTVGMNRMPAAGNRSSASMYADPTMPNTSVTPCATSVSTNASEAVMRVTPVVARACTPGSVFPIVLSPLACVLFEMGGEDFVFARHAFGYGPRDTRNVEEVAVIQIVREAVAPPRAAAHRQRERQAVVEAAAGRDAMRLVDDHARNRQPQSELERLRVVSRMDADRMSGPLIGIDRLNDRARVREVACPVDGEHGRELLAGKRMLAAEPAFLDHQERRVAQLGTAEARELGDPPRLARRHRVRESAVRPHRPLQPGLLIGVEQRATGRAQRVNRGVVDRIDDAAIDALRAIFAAESA